MATHKPLPPLARLRELLDYDPETGVLTWRVRRGSTPAGSVAGCDNGRGWHQVTIDGVRYKAHRIAYYLGTGTDPGDYQIDHCPDPTRANNRLANLRLATDGADNCSTRSTSPTRRVVIAYPDGLLLQCPSLWAAARTLGVAHTTIRRRLLSGTPLASGHRVYHYPRTA